MNILIEPEQDGFRGHVLYEASHQELELDQKRLNLSQEKFRALLNSQKYVIRIHFSEAKAINAKSCMEKLKAEFPEFIWMRMVVANGFEGDYKIEFFSSNPFFELQEIDDFSKAFRSKIRAIILSALIIPIMDTKSSEDDEFEQEIDQKITRLTSILDRIDKRRTQQDEISDKLSMEKNEEDWPEHEEIQLEDDKEAKPEEFVDSSEDDTDIIQTLERAKKKSTSKNGKSAEKKEF
ncbi:hypothetical protein [Listeria valentina]|uniref:hypothetical protein n=1 Tax=Listeria valentina TaxID=2705293 RepID=UPI001430BEBF|nr:hypothetical protein [Listeria valentina]